MNECGNKSNKSIQWEVLCAIPTARELSIPIRLSENEFCVVGTKYSSIGFEGIWKYNVNQGDEWIGWIKYDNIIKHITWHTIAIDKNANKLYIYGTQNELVTLDFNSKQFTIQKKQPEFGAFSSAIILNSKMHLIGGDRINKHMIWDNNTHTFTLQHTFMEYGNRFYGHALIHRKSTNCMLLFGGAMESKQLPHLNTIYSYDMIHSKWSLLNDYTMPISAYNFGYIMTLDEKYFILFGGHTSDAIGNSIYILNLDTMKWAKSDIVCPVKGKFYAVIVGMDKNKRFSLINGYVRNDCKIINRLSLDLINLICGWYCGELFVHLLKWQGKHWRMNLSYILNSSIKESVA